MDISPASVVRRILRAPKVEEEDWHQTLYFSNVSQMQESSSETRR